MRFPDGVLIRAGQGPGNKGAGYVLRRPLRAGRPGWLGRLRSRRAEHAFAFEIGERDDAGLRVPAAMQARGINPVASARARSADPILGLFAMLRAEFALCLGCVNLPGAPTLRGQPTCRPAARATAAA